MQNSTIKTVYAFIQHHFSCVLQFQINKVIASTQAIKSNYHNFFRSALLCVLLSLTGAAVSAEMPVQPEQIKPTPTGVPKTKQEPARYVPGQLIVKFKDTLTEPADVVYDSGMNFQQVTQNADANLDKLNKKFKVSHIQPVFKEQFADLPKGASLADRRKAAKNKLDHVKTKFSKRSQRANKDKDQAMPDLVHVYRFDLASDADVESAAKAYAADANVEYATPNYVAQTQFVPNDPYYSSAGSWGQSYDDMWGLKKIEAGSAWGTDSATNTGAGVIVAVVDTGVDFNHPDISANIWSNLGETAGNNTDDDNNGFKDDIRGWDFVGSTPYPMDRFGHGTHVAGTIAATGNNGIGIVGVAFGAKIMPVKGLNDTGSGSYDGLAKAILYAADNGADVINNSWGGGGDSQLIRDAITHAHNLGVVVVVAAGNSSSNADYFFPAKIEDVLTVSASGTDDSLAYFSNWGNRIDVAAPGGGPGTDRLIYSNVLSLQSATTSSDFGPELTVGTGAAGTNYMRIAGTSMAAPHVSGVVALLLGKNPDLTRDQVMSIIKHSADDQVGGASDTPGFDPSFGWGRLNARKALDMAFNPPSDPPILVTNLSSFNFRIPINNCNASVGQLHIDNTGGGNLLWQASTPSWLSMIPGSGNTTQWPDLFVSATQYATGNISLTGTGAGNSLLLPVSADISSAVSMRNCKQTIAKSASRSIWYSVPDGQGGAITVWQEPTETRAMALYVNKTDVNGNPLWSEPDWYGSAPGKLVAGTEKAIQGYPAHLHGLVSDGQGGAIIIWMVNGTGFGENADLRAQRVDANGQFLWGSDGVLIASPVYGADLWYSAGGFPPSNSASADGDGGALVIWGGTAQRLSHDGQLLWGAGVPIADNFAAFSPPDLASDGSGGALIAWTQIVGLFDLYAQVQRIDASGQRLWQADGIPVSATGVSLVGFGAKVVSDGAGGALVTWEDYSQQPCSPTGCWLLFSDIYGARVSAAGQTQWQAGGVKLTSGASAFIAGTSKVVSDQQGGAILSWMDYVASSDALDIRAQRVGADGSLLWGNAGASVTTAPRNQWYPNLVPDGQHGAIIAWHDYSNSDKADIYLQHMSATGQPLFGDGGVVMAGSDDGQTELLAPTLVPTATGRVQLDYWDMNPNPIKWFVRELHSLAVDYAVDSSNPIITLPGAPTIGTATAGNASATVTFTPPASDGGSAILEYRVTSSPGNIFASGTASPITVTGLVNGTAYTFTVTANNGYGTGPSSAASNSVTPAPQVPSLLLPTASNIGGTTATLGATITTDGGAAITARGTCWGTTLAPTTNCVAEGGTATGLFTQARAGLPMGTVVYFRAFAENSLGRGYSEDAAITTIGVPTLTLPTVTDILSVSATLGATVTGDGGAYITERGTCYGTTPAPTTNCVAANYSLAMGEFTQAISGLAANTTYYFRGYADNAVGRGYSEDGTFTTYPATIDLVMTEVATNAVSVGAGESFTIQDTEKNQGYADMTVSQNGIRFYLSSDATIDANADTLLYGSRSVYGGLAAGQSSSGSTTVTVPQMTLPGTYYIGAIADFSNTQAETNLAGDAETNNALAGKTITVVRDIDLVMTAVSTTQASVHAGASFVIDSTEKNQGTTTTVSAYTSSNAVKFYLSTDATISPTDDTELYGFRVVGSLAAGASSSESMTVTVPRTTPPGTYYLGAIADAFNRQPEEGPGAEGNNWLAGNPLAGGTITVIRDVYLVITAVSTTATNLADGVSFTIDVTEKNQGTTDMTADFNTIQFYLSKDGTLNSNNGNLVTLSALGVSRLAAGASSTGSKLVKVPALTGWGTWYIVAKADVSNMQPEDSPGAEDNNVLVSGNVVIVGPNVDMVITSVSTTASSVPAGNSFSISDTEKNQGLTGAASNTIKFYLSTDATIDASTDTELIGTRAAPILAAGASGSGLTAVTVPTTVPPGTYYIGAIADATNVQFEANSSGTGETNNWLAGNTIIVTDSMAPSVPTGLSATAVSGNQINLSWIVSTDNVGVTGYNVYRNGVQVGTAVGISYSDTGLDSWVSYSYTVAACDAAGNCSAPSTAASAKTLDNVAPSVPTGLAGSAFSTTQINLTWNASTDNVGVSGYEVYRNGVKIGTPSSTSYSDTGLQPATSYSYTVAACDAAGNCSAQSTAISASTVDNIAPTTPTNLTATAVSKSQINLSWTASYDSIGVTEYMIERCTGSKCANFAQVATSTTNSFSNTGLAARTAYKYRVRAKDAAGNISGYSIPPASATTLR